MQKPKPTAGLRHIALHVKKLEACVHFYTELFGMQIVWQPDENNYYLTTGADNFALHRAPVDFVADKYQRLDHLGFFLDEREEVNVWHEFMCANDVKIVAAPKDHRDGTRSFYCADPDGNVVQVIYYPMTSAIPLSPVK